MIRWYVNKLHVSTSDETLIDDLLVRCARANYGGDQAEATIRLALKIHHANQAKYAAVMRGSA